MRVTVYTPWHLWSFLKTVSKPEIWYHSIHYMDLVRSFLGEPQGIYCKSTRHPDAAKLDGTRTTPTAGATTMADMLEVGE